MVWCGFDFVLCCIGVFAGECGGLAGCIVDFDCLRLICFSACVVLCLRFVWCV